MYGAMKWQSRPTLKAVVALGILATLILIAVAYLWNVSMRMPASLPSPYEDTANLAIHPDIATVVMGEVLEKSDEIDILPIVGSPDSIVYGYWRLKAEQYLVNPHPYPELKIRVLERFVRPDGSTAPILYPLPAFLPPGERAVLFLSRYSDRSEPPLLGDTFTILIGPLGHEAQRLIKDDQVHTVRNNEAAWEPLETFIARVLHVAGDA